MKIDLRQDMQSEGSIYNEINMAKLLAQGIQLGRNFVKSNAMNVLQNSLWPEINQFEDCIALVLFFSGVFSL